MDCSPPGSSVHGIFQARVLEWGAIAFSASVVKALKKTRNKMKLLLYKTMYEKPIANIISDSEKLKFFL